MKHYELGMFISEPPLLESPAVPLALESGPQATVVVSADELGREPGIIRKNIEPAMAEKQAITLPWRVALLYGWLGASLILMIRLVVTFALGVRLLHRARPLECEKIKSAVNLAKSRVGIGKDVKVYASEKIHSPVIWCWRRRPILLLSSTAGELNSIDWTGVISHELAHWKRRDYICGLLAEVIACILPWHPLLWWSKYRLITLSEQACDDWVVATGHSCADYADSLLNLTPEGQMAFVPAVVSTTKDLSGRVRRILTDACSNPQTGVIWAVLVSVMVACVAIGCAFMQTRPVETEASTEQVEKHYESLYEAVKAGALTEVKRLINEGANVNSLNQRSHTTMKYEMTPLGAAASENHIEIVKALLDSGANINMVDTRGYSALWYAVFYCHEEMVKVLISRGADVNLVTDPYDTELNNAIWDRGTGIVGIVKALLDAGANTELKDDEGRSPLQHALDICNPDIVKLLVNTDDAVPDLHRAALKGDLTTLKKLLEEGADINDKDEFDRTPIEYSLSTRQTEIVKYLLGQGVDVNLKTQMRGSPPLLNIAARVDLLEIVKILIARNVSLDATYPGSGKNALHEAAEAGNIEIAELLISEGIPVDSKDRRNNTPLHLAANADIAKFLISKGADVNAENQNGLKPFHSACLSGNKEIVEFFIDKGADVNARLEGQNQRLAGRTPTPLFLAVERDYKDLAELLINSGADVNAKTDSGHTALDLAEQNGRTAILKLLLKYGSERGTSPLFGAVTSGDIEQIKLLISQGADVNAKNIFGHTVLNLACIRDKKEIAELLIDSGADINAINQHIWQKSLHQACQNGYEEIVKLLIDKGADVNEKVRNSMTPLHLAARNGRKDIVELLIAKGADMNVKNNDGNTPLSLAEINGHTEIVELLRKHGTKE
ncbi:ankyrin repeat domain-containing protein [Planctomycetota bacterium]